jgi:hypothetical protein
MGHHHAHPYLLIGGNKMNQHFDCQVWDNITGEWDRITVEAEIPEGDSRQSEFQSILGQRINEAVSIARDEPVEDWYLTEAHLMQASGERVMMVQLFSLRGDISIILAVAVESTP